MFEKSLIFKIELFFLNFFSWIFFLIFFVFVFLTCRNGWRLPIMELRGYIQKLWSRSKVWSKKFVSVQSKQCKTREVKRKQLLKPIGNKGLRSKIDRQRRYQWPKENKLLSLCLKKLKKCLIKKICRFLGAKIETENNT